MNAGYQLKVSMDDKEITLVIRTDEFISYRKLIDLLRDLADQIEEEESVNEHYDF
jgi:hypothetical protein